jgi:hypothetical protein
MVRRIGGAFCQHGVVLVSWRQRRGEETGQDGSVRREQRRCHRLAYVLQRIKTDGDVQRIAGWMQRLPNQHLRWLAFNPSF